jgi:hypothetical protein
MAIAVAQDTSFSVQFNFSRTKFFYKNSAEMHYGVQDFPEVL